MPEAEAMIDSVSRKQGAGILVDGGGRGSGIIRMASDQLLCWDQAATGR
jgi:hypothetical protein